MTNQAKPIPERAKNRRGTYITGEQRQEVFVLLRAAGCSLSVISRLLRYSLREAYDLLPEITQKAEIEAAYLEHIKRMKNGKD